MVRTNFEQTFMQPELACSKSEMDLSNWMNRKQYEHWQSKYGQKYTNCFLQETSAEIISDLLNMNTNHLSQATILLVGHCHFKRLLLRPELVNNSIYGGSHKKEETSQDIRFSK